ncbi:MAG TPA: hypothetical protein VNK26_07740 [Pyrinomonadaceae bacterium]|nr:hypothetical protein [Pyrinomonadaceae bacterium]
MTRKFGGHCLAALLSRLASQSPIIRARLLIISAQLTVIYAYLPTIYG